MAQSSTAPIAAHNRRFLPQDFHITDWQSLERYYHALEGRAIENVDGLLHWLTDLNELQAVVQEDLGWRYIRMTRNTQDEKATEAYQYFIEHIAPHLEEYENRLAKKYVASPFHRELDPVEFGIHNRTVENHLELFREENIPLNSKIELRAQEYGAISGAMTVELDGKEYTLQQASAFLEKPDRPKRQQVWEKVADRRQRDRDRLDDLMDELVRLRTQVARNAGFDSYTDYKFRDLNRFDYGRVECEDFHEAVAAVVRPVCQRILEERRQEMNLPQLKPWDLAVDTQGRPPLHPFNGARELIDKTIVTLNGLDTALGDMIRQMDKMGHLDLESRIGKAPGGYNYPLNETGVPFIFMNAVGLQSDLTTMVHESGHAVHSFLTRELKFNFWKDVPSEVAELASMSMELITMDFWDVFYSDTDALRRARQQQVERSITGLPWIACVDAFQTWMYDNPNHTREQRARKWMETYERFHGTAVDYSTFEDVKACLWQRQLHIFEVPFYYIEYGMSQLGAFQVWRNFKLDKIKGLDSYLRGLRMGYTRPIGEVYAGAGIQFNFTRPFMQELFGFVVAEYEGLRAG